MTGTRFYHGEIRGSLSVPSSKSHSQRMILLSMIGRESVILEGISFCLDERAALELARSCGSTVTLKDNAVIIDPDFHCPARVNVGESATLYRLSIGVLAAMGCRTEFTGSAGLAARPIDPLINSLSECGVRFSRKQDGFVEMDATGRHPCKVIMDQSISSQFVSSMILFNSLMESDHYLETRNPVSSSYVDITVDVLNGFGYEVLHSCEGYQFIRRRTPGRKFPVEGDYSSALYPLVLGSLVSEAGIKIQGLKADSLQADRKTIDLLIAHSTGIRKSISGAGVEILAETSEYDAFSIDASEVPDSCPPAGVIGIFSPRGVSILNPDRLRTKESDRVSGIVEMGKLFGARLSENSGLLSLAKGSLKIPREYTGSDHRIIMSMIISAVAANGNTLFHNLNAIDKSYPGFIRDLRNIGVESMADGQVKKAL
jgi:3-phosphoshikimate 1-carboxyvinyltransferase